MKNRVLLLIGYIVWHFTCASCQFNLTSYIEMPPLYKIDDFDRCLNYGIEPGTYCIVYSEIIPNETSVLWEKINKFSSNQKRHYRHDHLYFGVCLERCQIDEPIPANISELPQIEDTEIFNHYALVHARQGDAEDRRKFGGIVHMCLNNEFQNKYGLKLRTTIEYCEKGNTTLPHDTLDYIVYTIFSGIFALTVLCSLFDYYLKRQQPLDEQNHGFYKIEHKTLATRFLTTFSICRNYYRIAQPHTTELAEELKFFDCYRVVGVILVNFAHVLMIMISVQIYNPEFLEQFFYRTETSIVENGSAILQIFFVMSSFLLYVNFYERQLIKKTTSFFYCILVYIKLLFYRYLRLLPSLAMFVLFEATILVRLQDGPFWRHISESERTFCRNYWWKNIFLINNFFWKDSCAIQTWYIAADMQLFALFLCIAIFIFRFPRSKKYVFGFLLILSVAIPALVTYFLSLDAVYHIYPENFRYLIFKNSETLLKAYGPFYTNIGGYLFGFIVADIYVRNRKRITKYDLSKYTLAWWLVFPVGFAVVLTGSIFISHDFEKPSIILALYAGFYRNILAILCAVAVLGMCNKLGWFAYEFTRLAMFRPLARISYQTYLWHIAITYILFGYFRTPFYINRLSVTCIILTGLVLSHLCAFFMSLFIEYPAGEVVKLILKKYIERTKQTDSDENSTDNENCSSKF